LIFPAIPKDWEVFDFIEDIPALFVDKTLQCSTGFYYKNIKRYYNDVYKITIQ